MNAKIAYAYHAVFSGALNLVISRYSTADFKFSLNFQIRERVAFNFSITSV